MTMNFNNDKLTNEQVLIMNKSLLRNCHQPTNENFSPITSHGNKQFTANTD